MLSNRCGSAFILFSLIDQLNPPFCKFFAGILSVVGFENIFANNLGFFGHSITSLYTKQLMLKRLYVM